jgi:hypothetical protein
LKPDEIADLHLVLPSNARGEAKLNRFDALLE